MRLRPTVTNRPPDPGSRTAPRVAALRHRNFALLWAGSVVSNAGSWMQIVAQGWLVYDLTHSPLLLGVVAMARALPVIFISPFGGVVADRLPRMRVMVISQAASVVTGVWLALLVDWGMAGIPVLVAFNLLSGVIGAFDAPARQAMLPDLVPHEDLGSAVALSSAAWQGAAMIGPALAGLLVGAIGIAGAFYVNAASDLAVLAALLLMRGVPARAERRRPAGFFQDFVDGLRHAARSPLLRALLVLTTVSSLFGRSYQQLMPVFAGDVLDVGATGLGLMLAAPGAGSVLGAVVLGVRGDVRAKGAVQLGALLVFSGLLLAFTANRSFALGLVLLTAMGACFLVSSSMNTTMLQLAAPLEMRGRIMSYVTVIMQGFAPVGALLAGSAGSVVGTPSAVAGSAVVVAAVAALSVPFAPVVLRFALAPPARRD
jgi:MFS family permease